MNSGGKSSAFLKPEDLDFNSKAEENEANSKIITFFLFFAIL